MMLQVGSIVELHGPLKPGPAELVAVIARGELPDPRNVVLWWRDRTGKNRIPPSAYRAQDFDRFIFSRGEGVDGFVVIPEKVLTRLCTPVVAEVACGI